MFICDMIFVLVVQPLLDSFTSLIMSFIEMIKSYFAVKIANNNQKIQETGPSEPQHVIGFVAPDDDEYYGEEEEFNDI